MSADSSRMFFEEFIDDYFAECEEHLNSARTAMLKLESLDASDKQRDLLLDDLLRDFHSIKGLSAMVGMEEVTQLSHHIEDYFRELKDPRAQITSDGVSQILAGTAAIEQVLNARRKSEAMPDISSMLLQLTAASESASHKTTAKRAPTSASAGPTSL